MRNINQDFSSLEQDLQEEMENVEQNYPGYDEYIIKGKEKIGHNVHELLSYITSRYGVVKEVSEKNVKGFRTDEFLVDLSRLAQDGPFEIDGRRLDLQQTKDTNQGMLLHGAAGRGYVGFIVFKEA